MNRVLPLLPMLMFLAWPAAHAADAVDADDGSRGPLFDTVAALDAKVFEAYNRCDMQTFENYFVPDVEFYHDKGGVTWKRQDVVDGTRKYICGKVRRELVPGTLRVFPIKEFGAIEEGEHRFCQLDTGQCEGIAKFVMIWRQQGDSWLMTRVLSYGHRPNPEPAQP